MSKRWSYAVLVVAMGCGNTPINNTPIDAQVGSDVVDQDVVDAGGGGQDVVDAGSARPDVVDAGGGQDVVDAAMAADVVDGGGKPTDGGMTIPDGGGMDGGGMTDGGAADAQDVIMAPDVQSVGCAMPLGTITLPGMVAPLMGVTGGMSTVPSTGCQGTATGPENVYTLTLTAPTGVVLSTEGTNTSFDTIVSVRRTCADVMTQVACDDDGGDMPSTSSIVRTALPAGTYSVIVDGFNGQSGRYTLSASTFAIDTNAICATATALTSTGLMAQDLARGGNAATACAAGGSPQHWYSITVPANTQATVRATPTGMTPMWTPVVRILDTCDATTCLANGTGGTGTVASATVINSGSTTRTYLVSVNANSATATGTFDLALATQMVVPGTVCTVPFAVTPGMDLTMQDTTVGVASSALCSTSNSGRELFYSVTIPAGQYARVSATSTGMTARAPVVRTLDACPATACEDFNVGTTTADGVAYIANTGTAPRTAIFSVSTTSSTTTGTFTVRAALSALAGMGTTCAAPVALASGVAANGNSGNGFLPNRVCSTSETGPQSFYSLTIPARQRSRIVVAPAMGAMYTARLRVLDSCTATTCVTSPVASTAGGAVETTVNNDTDMPRSVIVSVAATNTMNPGAYTVTATNSPIPGYTVTSIPAACDDLSAGMALSPTTGMWTDDNYTATAALPFTLSLFGEPATHFSVSSNGFVQLYANAMGAGLSSFSNTTLPNSSTPNGVIAAFWDDLYSIDMTTGVRSATLGTMPNRRFVIEWANWETGEGSMGETLTFQAKLFETTGTIEVHHCNIAGAGARSRGNSATVGIENLSGTLGSLVSLDTANSVTTMTGRRFTVR
jgi:hypothetical protein